MPSNGDHRVAVLAAIAGVVSRDGVDVGGADALATDLRLRDESDAARMQPALDATEIDTTSLQVGDVVDRIEALVRERTPAA